MFDSNANLIIDSFNALMAEEDTTPETPKGRGTGQDTFDRFPKIDRILTEIDLTCKERERVA